MVLNSAFRTPTVGLDIGSSAVRAVVLKKGRSSWSLVAAGEEALPDNCIQDGATLEPALVSGAVILETIFSWPGMGNLFYESISRRDYPLIMGLVLMFTVLTLAGQLIADIAYAFLDPRITYK